MKNIRALIANVLPKTILGLLVIMSTSLGQAGKYNYDDLKVIITHLSADTPAEFDVNTFHVPHFGQTSQTLLFTTSLQYPPNNSNMINIVVLESTNRWADRESLYLLPPDGRVFSSEILARVSRPTRFHRHVNKLKQMISGQKPKIQTISESTFNSFADIEKLIFILTSEYFRKNYSSILVNNNCGDYTVSTYYTDMKQYIGCDLTYRKSSRLWDLYSLSLTEGLQRNDIYLVSQEGMAMRVSPSLVDSLANVIYRQEINEKKK